MKNGWQLLLLTMNQLLLLNVHSLIWINYWLAVALDLPLMFKIWCWIKQGKLRELVNHSLSDHEPIQKEIGSLFWPIRVKEIWQMANHKWKLTFVAHHWSWNRNDWLVSMWLHICIFMHLNATWILILVWFVSKSLSDDKLIPSFLMAGAVGQS